MQSRRYPLALLFLIIAIAIVNYLAVLNYWYWRMKWFDMPMHFFGGVWLGGTVLWWKFFSSDVTVKPRITEIFLWSVLGALVVGVGWEVYEGGVALLTKGHLNVWTDTVSDLLFDALGAVVVAILVIQKNKRT